MVVEARVQRPQSPQRQVTVERRAGQPEAIRPPGELLVQRALARHHRAADHVAVAVQVLGGRMHYEVCPKRERLLQAGERKVLSTAISAPQALPARATAAMSVMRSSGLLGVSIHSSAVGFESAAESAASSAKSTNSTSRSPRRRQASKSR